MNLNVVNRIHCSGLDLGYPYLPVQLPNIPLINNLTILANSGSTGPIYIGGSGMTVNNSFQLNVNAGISLAVDNANLIFCVTQSGYTGKLNWIGN